MARPRPDSTMALRFLAGGLGILLALVLPGCTAPAESASLDGIDAVDGVHGPEMERTLDPVGALLTVPPVSAEAEEEILDALRDAIRTARDNESHAAALEADSLLALLPALADWRPLLTAEVLAFAGDTAGVRATLEEVDPATELMARWGWSIRVDALDEAGDPGGALDFAARYAEGVTDPTHRAEVRLRMGALALDEADTTRALEAWHATLTDAGPGPGPGRSAALRLDDLLEARGDGALPDDEALRLGRALLGAGAWERAHHHLAPFIDHGALDQELRLELGRALVERRRSTEAVTFLEPLTGADVDDDLAARAYLWTGRAHLQANRSGAAEAALLAAARRVPGSALAEEALLLLIEDVEGRRGGSATSPLVHELLRTGVGSASGELLAVRHGAQKYLSGDYDSAASTFEEYLEGARRTGASQQASYWAALAHDRMGNPERATFHLERTWETDPLSFYGIFAGERIDAPVLPADLDAGPPPTPGLDPEMRNALTRLRVHQIVPTPGSFNHELERLETHFLQRGDGAYDFAERLIESEFPIQGVVLGRQIRAAEGEWNLRLLRIVYPFPYRDALVREARAQGLDPFFVAGLIRQESLWHPTIESTAGAVGLMQLLPTTAQEVARTLGIRYSRAQLGDPDYNLRLGTQYLASMIRRFDGRAEDALSAYNAGPGRINQWRQRPEYRDRDVFVEHIPFQETRNYVKVVQQNTRIYTALYGCPGFEPCLGDSYRVAQARSPFAGGVPGSSLAR